MGSKEQVKQALGVCFLFVCGFTLFASQHTYSPAQRNTELPSIQSDSHIKRLLQVLNDHTDAMNTKERQLLSFEEKQQPAAPSNQTAPVSHPVSTTTKEPPSPAKEELMQMYNSNYQHLIYPLLLSPVPCERGKVKVIIIVSSLPEQFFQRQAIRSTWGATKRMVDTTRLVFMLGGLGHLGEQREQISNALGKEKALFDDLVQYDFVESYRNLTLKSVLMLEWASNNCADVRYLLKTDDDMYLNINYLMENVNRLNLPRAIYGYIWAPTFRASTVIRNPKSKYYVPEEIWEKRFYPRYASGSYHVITMNVVASLLENCRKRNFLPMEDVYVTGICSRGLPGIVFVDWTGVLPTHYQLGNDYKICGALMGHKYNAEELEQISYKCTSQPPLTKPLNYTIH